VGIWFGAPLLVAYGLLTFALQYKTVARAFASLWLRRAPSEEDGPTAEVEVPMKWFAVGTAAAGAAVVAMAQVILDIPLHYGALAVFLAFFLALVAARATGETDITPGGPLGKIVQLTFGVLMPQSYTANLMTASITAGTSATSADLLTDLKSGYLLGAHPRRQFVAQFLGIFTGTAATLLGYYVLVPDASVFNGTAQRPATFPAPGAQQWRAVAELFKLGVGNLHPMARYGIAIGLFVGSLLAVAEWLLPKYKRWIPSATGLGLGMMLPFFESLSFLLGAVGAWLFGLLDKEKADRFVVPISSGLIAGESICGVAVAILNVTVFT
jgi:uncharacterized oligopeptide transporter (OPT) family protein